MQRDDWHDAVALVVGAFVGLLIVVNNVAIWLVDSSSITNVLAFGVVVGTPLAIVTLIFCGVLSRRFRLHLVVVGALLLASPFIGFGLSSLTS